MSLSRRFSIRSKKAPVDNRPFRQLSKGDVVIRTSDGMEFQVDKCILANASPFFEGMFSLPRACTATSPGDEKQTIDVTETKDVWSDLLGFIYLIMDELFLPLDDIRALLEAAQKYQMDAVTRWLSRTLLRPEYVGNQPLRVYALAHAYGLDGVVRVAARGCLNLPADLGEAKELELITALQYTRLLEYRKQCAEAAISVTVTRPVPGWMAVHGDLLGRCETCSDEDGCDSNLVAIKNRTRTKTLLHIREAWFKYFEALGEQMKTKPLPHVARLPMLLGIVTGSVGGCNQCKLHGLDQATKFSALVAARIEEAISKIKLEI
ncbi:hypothetical protein VTO73DRAFT_10309 [Trametes versicolor]